MSSMSETTYHIPVLLHPTVDGLNIGEGGVFLDLTFGGGGHSREILHRLSPTGRLFGFDQDADVLPNVPDDTRFTFVQSNFRYIKQWLRYYGIAEVDGILADLGVSSHHFDDSTRGFSFRFEGALDMRMNQRSHLDAATIVNTYTVADLARILRLYGELKNAGQVAARIAAARATTPLTTIEDLLSVITPCFKREREKKEVAKVFQALRIEVNQEIQALEEMLLSAIDVLRPGGRLSILTYHSLEDRLVKNVMRSGNVEGKVAQDFYGNRLSPMRPIYNKVIVADAEEVATNPRSRSAKLRVAEKVILPTQP